jgi:hypothetical protein
LLVVKEILTKALAGLVCRASTQSYHFRLRH